MTVLITGANRGIGRALFDRYREAGREVMGTTRETVEAEDWITLDVTDEGAHRQMCARLDDTPVDILVCNAGVYLDKKENLADGFPPEMWAKTFAANVMGVFLTVQNLLTNLQTAGGGKVCILSSGMGSSARASGGSYIYRASKAAVANLGRNLAADLSALDIEVGIYSPGWVQTDMGGERAKITPEESARKLVDLFDALTMEETGQFFDIDGNPIPF